MVIIDVKPSALYFSGSPVASHVVEMHVTKALLSGGNHIYGCKSF